MPHTSIQKLLQAASAAVIAFGALTALAAHPTTGQPLALIGDLVVWPLDGRPAFDHQATRILAAIGGGVMVGWGVLLWQLATHLLPANPVLAAKLIRTSVVTWFAIDSTFSVVAGAPLNVAANTAFLAAFMWPLSRLSREAAAAR